MAVITSSTFDPLKTRCNVRLQQGVPIVDADWNEFDDIRKFEMRAYLKWFVGDGIPDGGAAFAVAAITPPVVDDLTIQSGVSLAPVGASNYDLGLRFSGRAIVDGLDVLIRSDTKYKSQPLFSAAAFGVPQIAPMPNGAGPIAVYLDVWERLVTSQEDPSLVLPGIGTESCARMKREWVVRTRSGNAAPQTADPDFIAGHSYYVLAVINRSAAGAVINQTDVQDSRHLRLSVASLESRVAFLERVLLAPSFSPSPNQFTPKLGLAGTNVTLFGNNFNIGSTAVRFGATAAAIVGVPTANQIVTTVPAIAPGPVQITVQTATGSVTSADNFVVAAPAPAFNASPNQFNPKVGPAGTAVTLFGTNLSGALSVRFGATAAVASTNTATQIIAAVPVMPAGPVTIAIQTPGGTATSVDTFTVT